VLGNAKLCDLDFVPQIEDTLFQSLHVIRTPKNDVEFVFNVTIVDYLLTDLQCQANAIATGTPTIWERTPELLNRAVVKFVTALNPIEQTKQLGSLCVGAVSLLGKGLYATADAALHPLRTADNIALAREKACEFIINTARFTVDSAIGAYHLSPEERSQRINAYWNGANAVYEVVASHATAENIIDVTMQIAADVVFLNGASAVSTFLRQIDAFGKISKEAKLIAQGLKNALEKHPSFVTTEGIVLKMSEGMKDIGGTTKTILDSVFFDTLKSIDSNIWQSPAGIIYGNDKKFGNTLNHMLTHMTPNPLKKNHTVFNVPENKIITLIDEAWILKGNPLPSDPYAYLIDMKKIIGTQGETVIKIIVKEPGNSELLTAYPVTI
jgi:hypothetical protein